jgi:hypothetical protein
MNDTRRSHGLQKVKLSLCLINYAPGHEKEWGSGGIAPPFLISAPDGDEWSAPRPCRFTSGEGTHGTHWIGGWVGLRVGLEGVENRKILPLPGTEPRSSSPLLYRLGHPGSRCHKKTPWPLVRKRTIPTERPPLFGEVSANVCG